MFALRDSTGPGASSDFLLELKVWLIIVGIYIWEFLTNLHYEWDIIRGHQTHRWTIWIYLLARWATIIFVILTLIFLNTTSPINCQAGILTNWVLSFLSMGSGSLLLVLRILAIWNRNKVIVAIVATLCVANVSFTLLVVARIRTVWDPVIRSCRITNVEICKFSTATALATDTTLLLIMLAGLLRLRHRGGSYELWHLLWKQGVIWFVIAAAAEVPAMVLMTLNVNETLHILFVFPSVVMTVIASTRMHRSLQYFVPLSSTAPDSSDQKTRNSRLVSKTKNPQASIVRMPSNRLEVSVHTTYEEYSTSQMNYCDSYPDKARGLDVDDKVEGCEGKVTASERAAV